MDESETNQEMELPPQIELEVDPFESIIDSVTDDLEPVVEPSQNKTEEEDPVYNPEPEEKQQSPENTFELKLEPECETMAEVKQEKIKKKRGRPKKQKTFDNNSSSSDDVPLKRKRSPATDVKSENSQETKSTRRTYRSKRPSSFVTKYDTSGSEDEKIAFRGVHLSDDEYTPDKEPGKRGRKKRYDSTGAPINGSANKNLSDFDMGEGSQDALENVKIESVSSIKKTTELSVTQIDAAAAFLTNIMKSAGNLGIFVQTKAEEFVNVRLSTGFVSDTSKLQFCVEKSFKLLEIIKNNLKAVDTELRESYINYVRHHKLQNDIMHDKSHVKFLNDHRISFTKNGTQSCPAVKDDSDSDCAIVAEIPSTPKKSLDILRKVEKNGISWKTHRGSVSSRCSDGSTKILIPGKSTIFLNKNIQVKKVQKTPEFESFFREDGRTLKPPDDKENNFKTKFKVKKLEKTALVLGWLDLAYRKVSKQFFSIVREYERKKHYDSCSDLGESCSSENSESEQESDNYEDLKEMIPKTLSKICLDEINKFIQPSFTVSYQSLEEQYRKCLLSLKKHYSFPDDIFMDDCLFKSPKSLLNLCVDSINNYDLMNLHTEQSSIDCRNNTSSENNNKLQSPSLNVPSPIQSQDPIVGDISMQSDNKEHPLQDKNVNLTTVSEVNHLAVKEIALVTSTKEFEDDLQKTIKEAIPLQKELVGGVIGLPEKETSSEETVSEKKSDKELTVEKTQSDENANIEDSDLLMQTDYVSKKVSAKEIKAEKLDSLSSKVKENLSGNKNSLLEIKEETIFHNDNSTMNIEIKTETTENTLAMKDLAKDDSNEDNVDGYHSSEGDITGEDPMLQISCEVYLENDKFTRKSKKALKDLLQSSSSSDDEGGDLMNPSKRRKIVKRKKTLQKKTCNKVVDEDDWIICNDFKNDIKLRQMCAVNIERLSWDVIQPLHEDIQKEKDENEIDRLLDFSTLAPRSKAKSLGDEQARSSPSLTTKTNNSKQAAKEKTLQQNRDDNLLELITSGAVDEDLDSDSEFSDRDGNDGDRGPIGSFSQGMDKLCNALSLTPSTEPAGVSLDKLAKQHKEKNNILAKNSLLSSSDDESEEDDIFGEVTVTSEKKPTKKPRINLESCTKEKEDSENSNKKNKNTLLDEITSLLTSSEDEEATPQPREEITNQLPDASTQHTEISPTLTVEKSSMSVNHKKNSKTRKGRKKKLKIVTESDEERKKFQRKRKRLIRKEEKRNKEKNAGESSDDGSVLTISSMEGSESSSEETATTYKPSSQRENINTEYYHPVIKREPGSEHTPKTPQKKRLSAQQLIDNEEENVRIQDTNLDEDEDASLSKGRKRIRGMLEDDSLLDTTKLAAKEEEERLLRVIQKNIQLNEFTSPRKDSNDPSQSLILDADMKTKVPLLSIHPSLVKIMKEHQIDGVRFMWDTCFESVKMVKDGAPGGGCILAHCMGLGKSLQVISLVHTLLSSDLPFRTVLICCPLSTVLNWADEFKKWLRKINCAQSIKVYELSKFRKHYERSFHLEDWHRTGGVFIIGYEMFRLLTTLKESSDCKSHVIKKIHGTLLNPGPDIVVCDEGHLLKNDNTTLARIMYKIRSKRRIVLTGTPLQNNLKEYYCMVNFVKPNLLGSRKEYSNRFENPILNGQHRDSSDQDIKVMKKRSHVLHKMLEGCVQRKEATLLYKYLPRKREYVLLVTLSECQSKIYRHYLSKYAKGFAAKGTPLLKDFHTLQKIWTHPRTLHKFFIKSRENKLRNRPKEKVEFKVDDDGVICIEDVGDVAEETLAAPNDTDWWMDYISQEEMENLSCSPKFSIALQLLDESLQAGDKMLIFSTSLFTLDALEFFLKKNKDWVLGKHYYRLDGSVSLENRQKWCRNFNSERNKDVKLFLISTRAGGLGINMIAANRVIIMDVSWNPSHDIQSIFRVYRFGQKKDCYVYRLVAMGTMEEKIYERSVTKQAISLRVVDEQQIDRHYNTAELSELYTFNPVPEGQQPVPSIPSDEVLASVLASSISANITEEGETSQTVKKVPLIWSLHEHDSLLRDLRDEQLPEQERVDAWLEYQAEREQQKKNKEKHHAVPNNCIVPDVRLPELHPLGARFRQPSVIEKLMMANGHAPGSLLEPVAARNAYARGVGRRLNTRRLALPQLKPYTLGSFTSILPASTEIFSTNNSPASNQLSREMPIVQGSNYPTSSNQYNRRTVERSREMPVEGCNYPTSSNQYTKRTVESSSYALGNQNVNEIHRVGSSGDVRNRRENASTVLHSSSYQLPLSFQDTFSNSVVAEIESKRAMQTMPRITHTQGNWVVPTKTSEIYMADQPSTSIEILIPPLVATGSQQQPAAAPTGRKSRKAKKKTVLNPVNHRGKTLLNIDESNPVTCWPIMENGYNSCEAESIVPDRDDSPIITIDSD